MIPSSPKGSAERSRKAISLGAAVLLAVSGIPPVPVFAEEPLISSAFPLGQPVITLEESNQKAAQQQEDPEIPQEFLMRNENPLSPASFSLSSVTVTHFPEQPAINAKGSNSLGKSAPYIGYVTLNGLDKNRFSYDYDLGAAKGARVDVTIEKSGGLLNLGGGFLAMISRQNKDASSQGLSKLHLLFEDADGTVIEKLITLNNTDTQVSFDLLDVNFDRSQVRRITLRQSQEDLASDKVAKDRRGEVFVMLSGVQSPVPAPYETPDPGLVSVKPQGALWTVSGANRLRGAVLPGFGKSLPNTAGYSMTYNLIAEKNAFVKGSLALAQAMTLKQHVKIALKNNVAGTRALVRFIDTSGDTAEYWVELGTSMRLFDLDLADTFFHRGSFDRGQVSKIEIETDRVLSPSLNGQIDLAFYALEEDAFELIKPSAAVQTRTTGQAYFQMPSLTGAVVFQLQIARDAGFTDIALESFPGNGALDVVNLSAGTYHARLRASKSAAVETGPVTQWSDDLVFQMPAETFTTTKPVTPTVDVTASGTALVHITPIVDAVFTTIEVASDSSFSNIVTTQGVLNTDTSFEFALPAGSYFVRYRADASPVHAGFYSPYSDTASFQITAPDPITLLKPSVVTVNSSFNGEDKIFFTKVAGAAVHQMQISRTEDFDQIVYEGTPADSPVTVVLNELRTYFIRVRGIKSLPVESSPKSLWSDTYIFDKVIAGQSLTPDASLTGADLTILPDGTAGAPGPTSVGPGGDAIDQAEATARGVRITYNTGSKTFAGGGFSYDNFGTQPLEFANLGGLSNLVFGIKGSATQVKFEVVDANGASSFIRLSGIRSDLEQFWKIPMDLITGIDKTKVRLIYFIVEGPGQAGTLEINRIRPAAPVQGISPDASLNGENLTIFPQGSAGLLRLTSIGSGPDTQDNAAATARGVEIDYNTGSNGFAGGGFSYDDFGTQAVESGNVSLLDEFVFGLKGTHSQLKFEVVDAQGAKASVVLTGISSSEEKFWKIPASLLTGVDLAHLRLIYFIYTGGGQAGTLFVNHIRPNYQIAPSANLTVRSPTTLPGAQPLSVAPVDALSSVSGTERGVLFNYQTGTPGWSGGGFSFSGSTSALAQQDSIVLGLKGAPSSIKLEVTDAASRRVSVPLTGILPGVEQFWRIPLALFDALDLSSLSAMLFIVEGQSLTGQLEINHVPGLETILPSVQNPSTLAGLPSPVPGFPRETSVGPGSGGATDLALETPRGMKLIYNTGTPGWAGGGFTYDDFGTGPFESANLSSLQELQFGIKGDAAAVKFEILDDQQHSYQARIQGIDPTTEKVWKIPVSMITGIDLTHVRLIYFIVEGANRVGQMEINYLAVPRFLTSSDTLVPDDLSGLPNGTAGAVRQTSVGPGGNATDAAVLTERGVRVDYNTGTPGWSGGGLTYDDFGTPGLESGNLSGLSSLNFGLKGNHSEVKLEIIDTSGQKFSLQIRGIESAAEKVWSLPVSWITGIDLTKVRLIYFIVEGQNKAGSLAVNILPPPFELLPSAALTPADISNSEDVEGQANLVTVHPAGASASIDFLASDRGFGLQYGTSTAGWSGGGVDCDNSGTPSVEFCNFSPTNQMMFGLKGSTAKVKLEIIDTSGARVAIPINGISSQQEKVWVLPFSLLTGIDISKVRQIYFIIEGNNQTGSLEVTFEPTV